MSSLESIYESLSDEVKAKLKDCKSPEELLELAKSEGIELSKEQVEAVAGGANWCNTDCPFCFADYDPWAPPPTT